MEGQQEIRSEHAEIVGHRDHPHRVVRIEHRFCGPPGIGNGGIVCALLADHCGPSIEVTLARPAPIERDLVVRSGTDPGTFALVDDERVLATGRTASFDLEVPALPSQREARAAARRARHAEHPFPDCFVCGPARPAGDGLCVVAGPVAGRPGLVASAWRPHRTFALDPVPDEPEHTSRPARIADRYLWAALDCPGGIAALAGRSRPIVLGRFTGRLEAEVRVDERCIVLGWAIASRGRKHEVGTAIVGESGRVCGRARAIWLEVDQPPRVA